MPSIGESTINEIEWAIIPSYDFCYYASRLLSLSYNRQISPVSLSNWVMLQKIFHRKPNIVQMNGCVEKQATYNALLGFSFRNLGTTFKFSHWRHPTPNSKVQSSNKQLTDLWARGRRRWRWCCWSIWSWRRRRSWCRATARCGRGRAARSSTSRWSGKSCSCSSRRNCLEEIERDLA